MYAYLLPGLGGLGELVRRHAHVVEDVCQLARVYAAAVGHVLLTTLVNVCPACCQGIETYEYKLLGQDASLTLALQTLAVEAVQQRSAVVAPSEATIIVNGEAMRDVNLEASTLALKVKARSSVSQGGGRLQLTSSLSLSVTPEHLVMMNS